MIKLEEDEKLILEGRKHWFVAFHSYLRFFVSALIPPVIVFIL